MQKEKKAHLQCSYDILHIPIWNKFPVCNVLYLNEQASYYVTEFDYSTQEYMIRWPTVVTYH